MAWPDEYDAALAEKLDELRSRALLHFSSLGSSPTAPARRLASSAPSTPLRSQQSASKYVLRRAPCARASSEESSSFSDALLDNCRSPAPGLNESSLEQHTRLHTPGKPRPATPVHSPGKARPATPVRSPTLSSKPSPRSAQPLFMQALWGVHCLRDTSHESSTSDAPIKHKGQTSSKPHEPTPKPSINTRCPGKSEQHTPVRSAATCKSSPRPSQPLFMQALHEINRSRDTSTSDESTLSDAVSRTKKHAPDPREPKSIPNTSAPSPIKPNMPSNSPATPSKPSPRSNQPLFMQALREVSRSSSSSTHSKRASGHAPESRQIAPISTSNGTPPQSLAKRRSSTPGCSPGYSRPNRPSSGSPSKPNPDNLAGCAYFERCTTGRCELEDVQARSTPELDSTHEKNKKGRATLTAGPMADDFPQAAVKNVTPQRRPCVSPYMPPHVKQRKVGDERWEKEKAALRQKLEEEDAAGKAASAPARGTIGPNMRMLYRTWEPILEQLGPCCLNPLQRDEGVEVDVREGIRAKVVARDESSPSCVGPGIKGLPVVAGGCYHYEIELLKDSAVLVGWSAATSFPTGFDAMSFGYSSSGALVSNHGATSATFGLPFGKEGDVVGAMIQWPEGGAGPRISFMINGLDLGLAYDVASHDETRGHPPLQLHICQLPGPSFDVLLRGASESAPLRFPRKGFAPLGELDEEHFCPFSDAVAHAADYRALTAFDTRGLRDFHVPDSHVLQVSFDKAARSEEQVEQAEAELAADIAQLVGLPAAGAARALGVRVATPHLALVAFHSRAHAALCAKALGTAAATLSHAAAASRQLLARWRGTDFRAPRAPTVARRIIHGALGLQLPISHLAQERDAEARRRHSPKGGGEITTTATPSTRSRSSSSAEFIDAAA